jgi:hypothetical protein
VDIATYSINGIAYYPVLIDLVILIGFAVLFLGMSVKLHERNMPKRM